MASNSTRGAIGADRLLVVVLDESAADVHILALQLAVGRLYLGTRVEIDVSLATVQGDEVAGLDLA